MNALTKQQVNTTQRLKSKKKGISNPKPVNSCDSIGGGQKTIGIGVTCAS